MAAMKAGIFKNVGVIESGELPLPSPGAGEVLLRVLGCGVCGTDYHIFEGHLTDGVCPPVVLGHEIAARVERVGGGVTAFEPGQLCAVDPVIGCGVCRMCRSHRPNLCIAPTIIGYKLNGGFAQYLVAPAAQVVPLDESVGVAGGVLCETLACVVNGYDKLAPRAGGTALVLGAGTVGLLWLQMLSASPLEAVLVSEPVSFRRDKAETLGAELVFDPSDGSLAEQVRAVLPDGADYIVDATGSPAAVEEALPLLSRGGTFMIFGVCPAGSKVRFDPFELYNKEARIISSKMPPGTLDRAAAILEADMIATDEIVTAALGLDQLAAAVANFTSVRDSQVKVMIDPWA